MLFKKIRLCILLIAVPSFIFSQQQDSIVYKIGQMIMVGLPGNSVDTNSTFYKDIRSDMQMKAISTQYGLKESIKLLINAGVDVLLFSGNINSKAPNTAGDIVDIILQLLKEGKITKQQIDASYKRIIRMKNERKNL